MVEVVSVTFLDLVRQDLVALEAKKQAELEAELIKQCDRYDVNKETAESIGLDQALTNVADYLKSLHYISAEVEPSPEPKIFTETNIPYIMNSSQYTLTLTWQQSSGFSQTHPIKATVSNDQLEIASGYHKNKTATKYKKILAIPELKPEEMHQTLFEAYKFATYGFEKGEPVS